MTNRRNQIEIENVHNLIHHVEIESLFVFFQNFNRTVLTSNDKLSWMDEDGRYPGYGLKSCSWRRSDISRRRLKAALLAMIKGSTPSRVNGIVKEIFLTKCQVN